MKHAIASLLLPICIGCPPSVWCATKPKEGTEVGWWKLPAIVVAGNDRVCGFAWDGAELWVTNYSYRRYDGKAYRLDILAT